VILYFFQYLILIGYAICVFMSRHLFLLISCHLFSCYLIKTVLIQFLVLLMSGGSSWSFFYCLFICTEPYLKWVFQGFSFSRDSEVGSLRFRQVKTISVELYECSCLLINGCKISLYRFSFPALSQKYVVFFAYTCSCYFYVHVKMLCIIFMILA